MFAQKALDMVHDHLSSSEAEITVIAPDKFAVEEMLTELEQTNIALTIGLGPTAERLLKRRLISKLLPNLPPDDMRDIEDDLEQMAGETRDAALEGAFNEETSE